MDTESMPYMPTPNDPKVQPSSSFLPPTPLAVTAVATLMGQAPSIHNSQPWALEWDGEHLDIFSDTSRQLSVLDPDARQLHISCGAAILHARIAFADLGFAVKHELLPRSQRPGHLGRITPRPGPESTPGLTALLPAIMRRRTDRRPFARHLLPALLTDQLQAAAKAEGSHLQLVDSRRRRALISQLVTAADRIESAQAAYRLELEHWTSHRPETQTGVPTSIGGPGWRGIHGEFRLRDFGGPEPGPQSQQTRDEPTIAVLSTAEDTPRSWLQAGQALERVLLTGTMASLTASMLNQPIEIPGTRDALRSCTHQMGYPQVILRFGYGLGIPAATPRRPTSDILVNRMRPIIDLVHRALATVPSAVVSNSQ